MGLGGFNHNYLDFLKRKVAAAGASPEVVEAAVNAYLIANPISAADVETDYLHRFMTDAEKTSLGHVAADSHVPGSDNQDLSGYVQTSDARLTDARIPLTHVHDYEPANANIQTHVVSAHAPSNAQANADITKGEIEAKLTGAISTHTHAGGSDPLTKLIVSGDKPTGANTTPVTLAVSFPYEANKTYVIDIYAMVAPAAATTGCGFLLDVSTAVTYAGTFTIHQLAATGTVSGGSSIGDLGATAMGVSSGMVGTGSNFVSGSGLLITGANTGTATFFFRSETTAVTTCKSGSVFRIHKIN